MFIAKQTPRSKVQSSWNVKSLNANVSVYLREDHRETERWSTHPRCRSLHTPKLNYRPRSKLWHRENKRLTSSKSGGTRRAAGARAPMASPRLSRPKKVPLPCFSQLFLRRLYSNFIRFVSNINNTVNCELNTNLEWRNENRLKKFRRCREQENDGLHNLLNRLQLLNKCLTRSSSVLLSKNDSTGDLH